MKPSDKKADRGPKTERPKTSKTSGSPKSSAHTDRMDEIRLRAALQRANQAHKGSVNRATRHHGGATYVDTHQQTTTVRAESNKEVASHRAALAADLVAARSANSQAALAARQQNQLELIGARSKPSSSMAPSMVTQRVQSTSYTAMGMVFRMATVFIVIAIIYKLVATGGQNLGKDRLGITRWSNPGESGSNLITAFKKPLVNITSAKPIFVPR